MNPSPVFSPAVNANGLAARLQLPADLYFFTPAFHNSAHGIRNSGVNNGATARSALFDRPSR